MSNCRLWMVTPPHVGSRLTQYCDRSRSSRSPRMRSTVRRRPRGRPAVMTTCLSHLARANSWPKSVSICPRPPVICCSAWVRFWHKADIAGLQPLPICRLETLLLSLRLDTGEFDHLRPFFDFIRNQPVELGWSYHHRVGAQGRKPSLDGGIG